MSDSGILLERIEEMIVAHGGDLGGWTRLSDGQLQLFDGQITLRAEIHDSETPRAGMIHVHVLATLHDYDDEVLDACMIGIGDDFQAAASDAAMIWTTGVAGPIKSFINRKPVCMTCQAGVVGGDPTHGYSTGDYGLPGLHAYVGPVFARGFGDAQDHPRFDDTSPWFRFAFESAAPRHVHLAKATVMTKDHGGWSRDLEIDGHDVSFHDPNWYPTPSGRKFGYMTRFAVFEFPRDSAELDRRRELERTIRFFAQHLTKHDTIDVLMQSMIDHGYDPELVHETEAISTIAFGRALFEQHGVQYPATVIRARRDGQVEPDVPLMSIPAYTRARAMAPRLAEELPRDDFQALCLYNAESNAIMQASEALGDKLNLTQLKLYPCVVPDRGVRDETMDSAIALLNQMIEQKRSNQKPWWKFW